MPMSAMSRSIPYAEVVQQSFRNSTFYPLASNLSGSLSTVGLRASGPIVSRSFGWQSRVTYSRIRRHLQSRRLQRLCRRHLAAVEFLAPRRRPHLDLDADRRLQPLAIQRARSDDRSEHDAAHESNGAPASASTVPIWKMLYLGMLVQYRSDTSNVAAFSMHDLASRPARPCGSKGSNDTDRSRCSTHRCARRRVSWARYSLAASAGRATGRHRDRGQSDCRNARRPAATTVDLTVGANIVHKERIHTTPAGTVQLLFIDKSTLSIAPNTNIVIDEYVYDPKSNSGHMLTNLTKGALRFVGGQSATKARPRSRRRMPRSAFAAARSPSFGPERHQGHRPFRHHDDHNGAGTVTISRPDFFVTILNWNTPPSEPQRVTQEEIAFY